MMNVGMPASAMTRNVHRRHSNQRERSGVQGAFHPREKSLGNRQEADRTVLYRRYQRVGRTSPPSHLDREPWQSRDTVLGQWLVIGDITKGILAPRGAADLALDRPELPIPQIVVRFDGRVSSL